MESRNRIGRRIERLRLEKNLTQREVAEAVGVKRETINQWESGTRDLKTGAIISLAKFFGVSADYILGLSDIKTMDAEQSMVCEYTGLSEKTVEDLHFRLEEKAYEEKYQISGLHPWMHGAMTAFLDAIVFSGMDGDLELALSSNIRLWQEEYRLLPEIIDTLADYVQEMRDFQGTEEEYREFSETMQMKFQELTAPIAQNEEKRNANYYVLQKELMQAAEALSSSASYRNLKTRFEETKLQFFKEQRKLMREYP